jgi:7-carboxy-7-deazaguanine synthase
VSAPIEIEPAASAAEVLGTLVVSEVFGPTFQGEGPSLGRRCSFLRLGACNLHCRWCDTPYTWDWTGRNGRVYDPDEELHRRSVDDVWADLASRAANMLVVSGGEPMLQQRHLIPLLERATDAGWWIEVETAGTIGPSPEFTALIGGFNVSPKLDNSGNSPAERYKPAALDVLQASGKASWKFVAQSVGDLDEISNLVNRHSLAPVYVMPEGITADVIAARSHDLVDAVLARGWNLTTRLQVLLYGNRRGI